MFVYQLDGTVVWGRFWFLENRLGPVAFAGSFWDDLFEEHFGVICGYLFLEVPRVGKFSGGFCVFL